MSAKTPAAYQYSLALSQIAKRRRTGTCVDCGTLTRYNGRTTNGPSIRCNPCAAAARATWNETNIIQAIQRWHAEHGRAPTSDEWRSRANGILPDYAPNTGTVQRVFGTWAAGLVAAGLPQPLAGHYQRNPRPNEGRAVR